MGTGHSHSLDEHDHAEPVPPRTKRLLMAAVIPVVVAIAVGLALLWPGTIEIDEFTESVAADDIYE
ncbi:MAG TPA: hypothetical protein VEA78_12740, partial [Acidimicrobiales bacterium]|nr:hypothetical protein [Acidimicrobiales bacterium]